MGRSSVVSAASVVSVHTAGTVRSAPSVRTVPGRDKLLPAYSSAAQSSTSTPFRSFICKIASRCNLDCDYCYVYNHADQSWRNQPQRMSLRTAAQLGRRMNEHALAHGLREVDFVMHGGEPLLMGVDYLRRLCDVVIENTPDVTVRWNGQTNGTLYTDEVFEFCREYDLVFGLSIDGFGSANDRHRLDHAGRSSHRAAERALELLSSDEGRALWGGILAVIDLDNDPLELYDYFAAYQPSSIDFLFPLAHHDLRPPGKRDTLTTTPYADWLLRVFDRWYHQRPQRIRIRRFRDIIALYLGAINSSEEWGLQPVDFIVVETNGEIQAVDTLKITYHGACQLGLDIFANSFDDALASPKVAARQESWRQLGATCRKCPVVGVCGGGYFPQRYSRANGFGNTSVYCADLAKLITEITAAVAADLRPRLPDTGV
ncbi:FxsB family cyclophane-forming radical SAM/SPASM peptide maturase [Nocardia bovistercoris]|uniref:FxsB family cyclophane-forming radical SAM/SPASM peptide maturase n=1 Tax=Nocardia bovistercoris TaxID=2785916 RepID=UPI002FCD4980